MAGGSYLVMVCRSPVQDSSPYMGSGLSSFSCLFGFSFSSARSSISLVSCRFLSGRFAFGVWWFGGSVFALVSAVLFLVGRLVGGVFFGAGSCLVWSGFLFNGI